MLSDFFGKPIVLNFWATTCGQCTTEMPEFQEVYEEYGEDVVFLFVDYIGFNGEIKKSAQNYWIANKFTSPLYFDQDREAVSKYGVRALPYTFFINSDGYIVNKINARIDKTRLLNELGKIYDFNKNA